MESLANEMFQTEAKYNIQKSDILLCGICGENHSAKDCHILEITNYVSLFD